jgi:hypothetical protein
MSEQFVDDFTAEYEAAEALYRRPFLTVFIGKKQRPGRTDVMAGSHSVPWFRAVSCVGGDHARRAADFVAEYRSRMRAMCRYPGD